MCAMWIKYISSLQYVTNSVIIYSNNTKRKKGGDLLDEVVVAFAVDILKEAAAGVLAGLILYVLLRDKHGK